MSSHLFQPDVLLSSQYFAMARRQAPSKTGEYRLLIALLEDAIERFKKYVLTGDQQFAEAQEWIMGSEQDNGSDFTHTLSSFSFPYVCGVLGFDPDHVRHGLRRWGAMQRPKRR
jgi:hypothetical protein